MGSSPPASKGQKGLSLVSSSATTPTRAGSKLLSLPSVPSLDPLLPLPCLDNYDLGLGERTVGPLVVFAF